MKIFYLLDYGGGYMDIHTPKLSYYTLGLFSCMINYISIKFILKKEQKTQNQDQALESYPQREQSFLINTFISTGLWKSV